VKRWPSFDRAARAFLDTRVRVTASTYRGDALIVDELPASIQPGAAFQAWTVAGKWTDATMVMFCRALDADGNKYAIRKGGKVEEIINGGVLRLWEVTDDPENFVGVYLAVPLKPRRITAPT